MGNAVAIKTDNRQPATGNQYEQMGAQLTTQYKLAISGMIEVVKFGAMLMQVRDTVASIGLERNEDGTMKGGQGLKAWLEEYAPEIKRPTAYRFLGVAEAVAKDYSTIVGAKVAKAYTLDALVMSDPEDLPEPIRAKQLELFDAVTGQSQRSWLDKYKAKDPDAQGGGGNGPKPKDATRQAKAQVYGEQLAGLVRDLRLFVLDHKRHTYLTAEQIETARTALQDVCKALK